MYKQIRNNLLFGGAMLLLSCGVIGGMVAIAHITNGTPRESAVEKFKRENHSARQLVHLPNGTFKMEGAILWQDRKWGEFAFAGLDDTVELPYDGQPGGARLGQIVLVVNSGSVRVREVK